MTTSSRPHPASVHRPRLANAAVDADRADPPVDARGGRRDRFAPAADPQLAGAGGPVPRRPRVLGDGLLPRGLLRRLRLVVVRPDHGAAVRLAGRVPVPEDPSDDPRDPAATDPREGARRVPSPRRGSRRHRTGRGRRDRRPPPAAEAVPRLARGPRRRGREGRASRGREPAVPLGLLPAPARRDRREGDGVHGARRRDGGGDVRRRAPELRRRDPHRPLLRRRVHGLRLRTARLRGQLPAERPADRLRLPRPVPRSRGSADRHRGDPREPSGGGGGPPRLPGRVRLGTGRRGLARRAAPVVLADRDGTGRSAGRGARDRDAVAGRDQAHRAASPTS